MCVGVLLPPPPSSKNRRLVSPMEEEEEEEGCELSYNHLFFPPLAAETPQTNFLHVRCGPRAGFCLTGPGARRPRAPPPLSARPPPARRTADGAEGRTSSGRRGRHFPLPVRTGGAATRRGDTGAHAEVKKDNLGRYLFINLFIYLFRGIHPNF